MKALSPNSSPLIPVIPDAEFPCDTGLVSRWDFLNNFNLNNFNSNSNNKVLAKIEQKLNSQSSLSAKTELEFLILQQLPLLSTNIPASVNGAIATPQSAPEIKTAQDDKPGGNDNQFQNTKSSQRLPDLVGSFGKIELPDTVDFGDHGQVKVIVSNLGNAAATGLVTIKLYISTDDKIDSNDALLTSVTKKINLQAGHSTTVNLDYLNNTSVIAPGAYHLIAKIDSENAIAESKENNNITSQLVSAPNTDQVIDWNATALNAIQAEGVAGRGVPPTEGSRLLAILADAVYDTVNAFSHTYTPYKVNVNAPKGASIEAAAAGAAQYILTSLLPNQGAMFSEQLFRSLGEIKDKPLEEIKGVLFGYSVAQQMLSLRANDGSDNNAPYVAPAGDYVWHPDAPNFTVVGQNWGKVTPFAIPSVDEFRTILEKNGTPLVLDATPTKNPELYAQQIEEVRTLGAKYNTTDDKGNPVTTITRTADQTQSAIFWAYDRADTFRPYGQLEQLTEIIAVKEGKSLLDNARLFAQLNTAMADAVIVAWDAKYKYTQPRPDDVIAGGIAANDSLASTIADPNWVPLLAPTPPFPDYASGHSSMGGAFAGVMSQFFGDNYKFDAISQELPGVVRHFDSFYDIGKEDALSRVYGGVHVREACEEAFHMGEQLGTFVANNLFKPA